MARKPGEEPTSKDNGGDDPVAGDRLKTIAERINRLEEEKKAIADDIKEVYAEAKANGYSVAILRKAIKRAQRDPNEVAEEDAILDLYEQAIGVGVFA
ncbi:hypothetical protein [EBPR siphovirus 2]|nr:hypothetical protein [EBPR siphovirus 2]